MRLTHTGTLAFTSLLLGAAASCAGDEPREEPLRTGGEALTAGTPVIDFDLNAPHRSWIALTFDDGPDSQGNTDAILDILAAHGAKATFFVCSNANAQVASSWRAQQTLARMVADGHQVGNHTAHHLDLGDPSVDVDAELRPVDDMLTQYAYDPGNFEYRLTRAPFGDPWFGPQARLDVVAPILADYGVHVGWNIDSGDSTTCTTAACVSGNVLTQVDAGRTGVVLMHSISAWSVQALPTVLAGLESRGKQLVLVEDLVLAKYGKPSRQLFTCADSGQCVAEEYCSSKTHHCTPRAASGGPADAGPGETGADASSAPPAIEAGIDAEGGAPIEAGIDAGIDAPIEAGIDAGRGAPIDARADEGIHAGDALPSLDAALEGAVGASAAPDAGAPDDATADTVDTAAPPLATIADATLSAPAEEVGAPAPALASGVTWRGMGASTIGAAGTTPSPSAAGDASAESPRVNGGCAVDGRPARDAGVCGALDTLGALAALGAAAAARARRRRTGA